MGIRLRDRPDSLQDNIAEEAKERIKSENKPDINSIIITGDSKKYDISNKLKELGIWAISEAKSRFERDLAIEDMPAIAIEYNRIKLRAECTTRTNAVLAAIDLGQATTVDDLKTTFSA